PTLPNALWGSRRAGKSAEAEREDQRLLRTMVSQALGRVLRGEGRRSRREPILPGPCLSAGCPQLKHRSRVTPRAGAHRGMVYTNMAHRLTHLAARTLGLLAFLQASHAQDPLERIPPDGQPWRIERFADVPPALAAALKQADCRQSEAMMLTFPTE